MVDRAEKMGLVEHQHYLDEGDSNEFVCREQELEAAEFKMCSISPAGLSTLQNASWIEAHCSKLL